MSGENKDQMEPDRDLSELSDDEIMNMIEPPSSALPNDDDSGEGGEGNETTDEGSDEIQPDQSERADGEETPLPGSAEGEDGTEGTEEEEDEQNKSARNPLSDPDEDDDPAGKSKASDDAQKGSDKGSKKSPKGDGKDKSEGNETGSDQKPGDVDKSKETAEQKGEKEAEKSLKPEDYKTFYDKVMAPFKANGREVKLSSPDEAIQLMQMGANYTKKMQALQPNLRVVKMLENQGLLDEGKLNNLIDLHKKNPDAIRKLVKDSGIDPMDLDTSDEAMKEKPYRPGNYSVSQKQMDFNSALEDAVSSDEGKELVVKMHREWDKASHERVFQDPGLLKVLTEQKRSGMYDQVATQVEHEKMLGNLQGVPYIEAYYQVAQAMVNQGLLRVPGQEPKNPNAQPEQASQENQAHQERNPNQNPNQGQGQGNQQQERQVLETRSAQRPRKSEAQMEEERRVKAAAPGGGKPSRTKPDFNPLSMSDEEFEKAAELGNRV